MLKIKPENKGANMVKPGARLYLTRDRSALVPEGHADAATLWCTEHDEVAKSEFERLAPEAEPEPKSAAKKVAKKKSAKKGAKK